MTRKLKRCLLPIILAAAVCLLAGCFNKSTDELYALPQLSDEFVQLQREIDGILGAGAEYSAPTSGSYRQAVQFEDIDSDGTNEALVFFTVPGEDLPLKVQIFENDGGTYGRAAVIEGSGTDIKSIEYVDMDRDGMCEIVVGWQIAPGVSMLSGYSLNDYQVVQLFNCDYTSYLSCEFTGKGVDLAVIGSISSEKQNEVTVYTLDGENIKMSSAKLSMGVSAVSNFKTGMLADGAAGIFVESAIDASSFVTNIMVYENGELSNISLRSASGISQGTARTYSIMSADIDGDGVTEVPNPIQPGDQTDIGNCWLVEWNAFDSAGSKSPKHMTLHNYSDGWYLDIPKNWAEKMSVRRNTSVPGERSLILSYTKTNGETVDFLAIHALSGDNRSDRAKLDGRSVITEKNSVIYAQEMLADARAIPIAINEKTVAESFHIIYSDLNS